MKNSTQSERLGAFRNVVAGISADARLPKQVFRVPFAKYFFFESDWLFGPRSAQFVLGLMEMEGARTCCLLNFSRTQVLEYQAAATIFVDKAVTNEQYTAWLTDGGPTSGWLYARERYGLSTDLGKWCIYCETNNDIAVIGLPVGNDVVRYLSALNAVQAKPIQEHLQEGAFATFPFGQLTSSWRSELVEHYGTPATP